MGLKQESLQEPEKQNPLVGKQFLNAPVKSAADKYQLLPEFLKVRGLVKQHLDSFNYFVKAGIKKIVRANDCVVASKHPDVYLRFKDVKIGEPSTTIDGNRKKVTPHTCRLSNQTYAVPILVNVEYTQGIPGQMTIRNKKDVTIGLMPILLRRDCCVLYNKDEAELAKLGECPLDPGGY